MEAPLALCGVAVDFGRLPVDVGEGEEKPFDITVNGTLVYSKLAPVAGETGPLLFSTNKWWGEPAPEQITRVVAACVVAAAATTATTTF